MIFAATDAAIITDADMMVAYTLRFTQRHYFAATRAGVAATRDTYAMLRAATPLYCSLDTLLKALIQWRCRTYAISDTRHTMICLIILRQHAACWRRATALPYARAREQRFDYCRYTYAYYCCC